MMAGPWHIVVIGMGTKLSFYNVIPHQRPFCCCFVKMEVFFLLLEYAFIGLLHGQHLELHPHHIEECCRRRVSLTLSHPELLVILILARDCDGLIHCILTLQLLHVRLPPPSKCSCGGLREHVFDIVHNEVMDKFALRRCNPQMFKNLAIFWWEASNYWVIMDCWNAVQWEVHGWWHGALWTVFPSGWHLALSKRCSSSLNNLLLVALKEKILDTHLLRQGLLGLAKWEVILLNIRVHVQPQHLHIACHFLVY